MVRKVTIPQSAVSNTDLLSGMSKLARLYGDPDFWYWDGYPYFWYWKGTDRAGHDLVLGWTARN